MNRLRKLSILSVLLLISGVARADNVQFAHDFMKNLGDSTVSLMTTGKLNKVEAREKMGEILDTSFAFNSMAIFTAGKYWKDASKDVKDKYLKLMRTYVTYTYADKMISFRGETFSVKKAFKQGNNIVVPSVVKSGDDLYDVDWIIRVRNNNGSLEARVFDVKISGLSLVQTQRNEFISYADKNGETLSVINDKVESIIKNIG